MRCQPGESWCFINLAPIPDKAVKPPFSLNGSLQRHSKQLAMAIMKACVVFAIVIGLASSAAGQGGDSPGHFHSLARTSCFGECPNYTVTIDARGTVTYEGEGPSVSLVVKRRASPAVVATLLASAERIHFFDLRDAYRVIENADGTGGDRFADDDRHHHSQRPYEARRRLFRCA